MSEDLKARVLALYAAVNAGDLKAVAESYHPRLRSWALPGDQPLDRDAVLAAFRALRSAFPDFHDQVEVPVAEGDMVVARVTSTGTHQGDFYGVPPVRAESFLAVDRHVPVPGPPVRGALAGHRQPGAAEPAPGHRTGGHTMTSDGGAILVLGATGKQGGAVARHLLARGRHVHALVRDPADPAAADLAAGGGELVQANLDDPTGIRTAVAGAAGVFCVLPYQPGHPEAEVRQGITVANAAAAAGIARLVYSSAAGADRGIGIPETDSKWAIEQHLAALDLPVTVLRPTFLMENFAIPELKQAILGGSLHFAMRADTRLQMVAADDVGAMAALAFDDPDAFAAPTELAGDELPMAAVADTFGRVLGRPVAYVAMPYESVAQFDPNLATLGAWLDSHGYGADIAALRRLHPGLQPLEAWLRQTGWASQPTPT